MTLDSPNLRRLQDEARDLAAQVAPTLERPQRADGLRRLKAYATTARNFAANRRLHRKGREDLRPLYFIWTLLRTCNFRCVYCDDHRGRMYPDLPNEGVLNTEDALRLLRVMRTGAPSVYFAGGEPMLRKDLPVLTREARDLSYYPIQINTNASAVDRLLKKPAWRTWLADTDIVIVSLDALDLGVLREMWAYRRPEDVLRNLLLLRELREEQRFKLIVNTVVQPGMVGQAREVLDLTNELGIGFVPVPVNIGPRVTGGLVDDPEYSAFVETILERKREGYPIVGSERMLRRMMFAEPLTCRNTLKPHVDYDGTLFWPCKASVNTEPTRLNVLDFEDLDSLWAHATSLVDPTGFHGPGPDQCGADCNWAQNYSTDAYAHGLEHPWTLLDDIKSFLTSPPARAA